MRKKEVMIMMIVAASVMLFSGCTSINEISVINDKEVTESMDELPAAEEPEEEAVEEELEEPQLSDEELRALPNGAENLIVNSSFETDEDWEIENVRADACRIEKDEKYKRSGEGCLKFWANEDCEFYAQQQVTLDAGTYCLGGYFNGDDCGDGPTLEVYLRDPNYVVYMAEAKALGYGKWDNPEVRDIVIEQDGTTVSINVYVQAFDRGYGSWDDIYLYRID